MRQTHRQSAFSLLELILVLALMLVLGAVFYSRSARDVQAGLRSRCAANLQTLQVAMRIFADDHGAKFPVEIGAITSEKPLGLLVPRYTSTLQPFVCPGTRRSIPSDSASLEKVGASYAYYMGRQASDHNQVLLSDAQVNSEAKAPGQTVFSLDGRKPGNNHRKFGGNFLSSDGRVESTSGSAAPFPLPLTNGIVLLNPRD